jgi:hypothetical protein
MLVVVQFLRCLHRMSFWQVEVILISFRPVVSALCTSKALPLVYTKGLGIEIS